MPLYEPFIPDGYVEGVNYGCGPASWKFDLVPDKLLGLDINQECKYHDYGYEVGETVEDKELHDRILRNNITRKVLAQTSFVGRVLKKPRLALGLFYYFMVHNFGGAAFWEGKNG